MVFHSINKPKTMKRILTSLFVTSVVICSASAAGAQTLSATSVHTGIVPASCGFDPVITATPGTLIPNGTATTSTTSLSSDTNFGSFTVRCNTAHSFTATLLDGTQPGTRPQSDYLREFRLFGAPPTHATITKEFSPAGFTVGGLEVSPTNGYSVNVAARTSLITAPSAPPLPLPVGTYVINIRATIAPGG
jgi:hypothetical protein